MNILEKIDKVLNEAGKIEFNRTIKFDTIGGSIDLSVDWADEGTPMIIALNSSSRGNIRHTIKTLIPSSHKEEEKIIENILKDLKKIADNFDKEVKKVLSKY